ncbi:MAG: flagellar hook-length control protein FliK [Desulfuromonadaceae bacterium]
MNNGQLNIVSVPTAMQSVSQQSTVSTAVSAGSVQQDDGNFAGVLSELQAKEDGGQASDRKDDTLDVVTDEPRVDLLALLQASPCVTPATPADLLPRNLEKGEADDEDDSLRSESSDVTSQRTMSAYAQDGRMPGVSIMTPDAIDMQQNGGAVTEKTAVNVASPAGAGINPGEAESKQENHAKSLLQSAMAATTADASQPQQSDRMSNVNKLTTSPVDGLQNVTTQAASEQPADVSASPDKVQAKQLVGEQVQATLVKAPVTFSAEAGTIAAAHEQSITQVSNKGDLPAATLADPSAESELEIQLSQPRPITTRVAVNARQQLVPEQQIEALRPGNERSAVRESGQSPELLADESASVLGADTSLGSDSSQGQSDVASDNQMLAQDMRGHLKTEQQKGFALAAKAVSGEPVRQDVQEQVMQQVKERLVQHDVKPGSQQITLTLSPDSLGELKMNLNLQGQKLSVEIVTENRTVRDAIIQHTDSLKESLARQNITMESFDVTTGGKGSGSQGQNQNAWRELAKQQQQQFWAPPRGYQLAQAGAPSDSAAYQRQQGQTMLDIHY